ncbi:DMT family transporter [Photobacterium damselae]|uniref:DMT family transporter n=1 Tax=Photobacterium damselae TaxID=38293 RepID=UPI0025429FBB
MIYNIKSRAYSSGLLSGIFWAINATLLSFIFLDDTIPKEVKGISFLVIVVAFFHDTYSAVTIYVLKIKSSNFKRVFSLKKHYPLILSGFLAGPIGLTCYMQAIKYLGVALATSTVAIYPIIIVVILCVFYKLKITKKILFSIVISVIGCIGINFFSYQVSIEPDKIYLGLFFAIICIFTWSFECIVVDRLSDKAVLNSDMMFFIRQVSSSVLYFIIVLLLLDFNEITIIFSSFSYQVLIFVASLFATMSYLYWYKSISLIGAPIATVLNVTYSFWGVIFGVLIFEQKITIMMFFSLIMIFSGIIILMSEENKKELKGYV